MSNSIMHTISNVEKINFKDSSPEHKVIKKKKANNLINKFGTGVKSSDLSWIHIKKVFFFKKKKSKNKNTCVYISCVYISCVHMSNGQSSGPPFNERSRRRSLDGCPQAISYNTSSNQSNLIIDHVRPL